VLFIKICLINPPQPFLLDPITNPPLGLLYLGAVIRDAGYDVEVYDLADKKAVSRIKLPSANIYGITAVTPTFPYANEIAQYISITHPESLLVVGGPHITAIPNDLTWTPFDVGVIGEGERTIIDLIRKPCFK